MVKPSGSLARLQGQEFVAEKFMRLSEAAALRGGPQWLGERERLSVFDHEENSRMRDFYIRYGLSSRQSLPFPSWLRCGDHGSGERRVAFAIGWKAFRPRTRMLNTAPCDTYAVNTSLNQSDEPN